jgi:anti-sigma factor RsiW
MSCRKIDKQMAAYIDGELDDKGRREMEAHIAACARCSKKLSALELLTARMGSLPRVGAPADFSQRLKARLDKEQRALPFWRRAARRVFVPFHIKVPLELAAAAAAAVLVIMVIQPRVEKEALLTMDGPGGGVQQSAPDQRMAAESAQPPPPAADRAAGLREEAPRFSREKEEGRVSLSWAPRQEGRAASEKTVRRKAEPAEPAPEVKGQGESPVISLVRRTVRQRNGSIAAVNRGADGTPASLFLEIPAAAYPAFISDLSRRGEFFQAPPEQTPDTADGTIEILLRLRPVEGD